jgi:hypothetical protein
MCTLTGKAVGSPSSALQICYFRVMDHGVYPGQRAEFQCVLRIFAVPEEQPATDRLAAIKDIILRVSGSLGAAGTSCFPFDDNPIRQREIAFAFGGHKMLELVARANKLPSEVKEQSLE